MQLTPAQLAARQRAIQKSLSALGPLTDSEVNTYAVTRRAQLALSKRIES